MTRCLFTLRMILVMVAALLASGCVTNPETSAHNGVQPEHAGYVPARIAILPCIAWPSGARYKVLPLTSAKDADLQALCSGLDAYVIAGFNGQPYMKGFSPKAVLKSLDDSSQEGLLEQLPALWLHTSGDCADCTTPPAYYRTTIARRPAWLQWLNTLSKGARNADAALLPFVTYAYGKSYDDRGLAVAERAAGVALLLVDTNNGELLWSGGREAAVQSKRLEGGNVAGPLTPPTWSAVAERLYTEELWREFPGRQVF